MADVVPFVNGVQHDWASIDIDILGHRPTGLTEINYATKRTKKNLYGKGRKVIGRGYGNDEPTASIGMHSWEWDAIAEAARTAGYDKIEDIPPFPIVVKYLKKGETKTTTHTITYAEFTENKRESKQGDQEIIVKNELIIAEVEGM